MYKGSVLDRETLREVEVWNEWGGGEEVEVLLSITFKPWVFGIVGGRANVRIEKAGGGKEMVFSQGVPDEEPTILLDEVCDKCFPVEGTDVTFIWRGVHGRQHNCRSQQMRLCWFILHLDSWGKFVGGLP